MFDMYNAFWWTLSMTCVVWYSTVTVYVAIKGAADIKGMLARLASGQFDADNPEG